MTEQTDVRELRERLEGFADEIDGALERGKYVEAIEDDADLIREAVTALERLEAELGLCRSFHDVAVRQRDAAWSEARVLREYYDASEQAEYAGRNLGTAAQAQAARRLEAARRALATPAPAEQTGGADA